MKLNYKNYQTLQIVNFNTEVIVTPLISSFPIFSPKLYATNTC